MKEIIKNRQGQKIVVILERSDPQKGLAFVMHGLGGHKEAPHIATFADSFKENGFSVVRFDTTNTHGESEGNYEDATTTNYYQDLEDVISWAQEQAWYQEPFVLAGHSLGGLCSSLYAAEHPIKVLALAPISTVVSGKLSLEAAERYEPEELASWEKTGWQERESGSKPGLIKRLKWSHMADRLKYDLLSQADKLTMPVLLIVGENDTSTPPEHQRIFYEALPGKKELHIINGSEHNFRSPKYLSELKEIFNKWVGSIG